MEKVMAVINFIISNYTVLLGAIYSVLAALSALVTALIALFMIIPGEFPEKQLQAIVDFISKYSKK